MQILKHSFTLLALFVATTALPGCDRGSSDYQYIKALPPEQWNSYASTLPIDRRLTLHKEVMARSSHNPVNTISESFVDAPEETYSNLVERLKAGDRSRFYLPVIYVINRSPPFKFCNQPDRKIIQYFLKDISTDAVKPEHRPAFYSC